jgi:hypothetical protein
VRIGSTHYCYPSMFYCIIIYYMVLGSIMTCWPSGVCIGYPPDMADWCKTYSYCSRERALTGIITWVPSSCVTGTMNSCSPLLFIGDIIRLLSGAVPPITVFSIGCIYYY